MKRFLCKVFGHRDVPAVGIARFRDWLTDKEEEHRGETTRCIRCNRITKTSVWVQNRTTRGPIFVEGYGVALFGNVTEPLKRRFTDQQGISVGGTSEVVVKDCHILQEGAV